LDAVGRSPALPAQANRSAQRWLEQEGSADPTFRWYDMPSRDSLVPGLGRHECGSCARTWFAESLVNLTRAKKTLRATPYS
jgi:hypothetical protein